MTNCRYQWAKWENRIILHANKTYFLTALVDCSFVGCLFLNLIHKILVKVNDIYLQEKHTYINVLIR